MGFRIPPPPAVPPPMPPVRIHVKDIVPAPRIPNLAAPRLPKCEVWCDTCEMTQEDCSCPPKTINIECNYDPAIYERRREELIQWVAKARTNPPKPPSAWDKIKSLFK